MRRGEGSNMTEFWKQCEGRVINERFPLRQHLGGSERQAVFLTEYGEPELQQAAIKIIQTDPRNAELQLSRWGLAAKLSHPHLIRIFQMGRCHLDDMELVYIVMEYAEENLSQVLPQRPLTSVEARDMLGPALDALAYVHGEGFVHGHIKPANIMAVGDQLKISSDGLCRIGDSRGGLVTPGAYDPPEIASGGMSPAGDVWSLAVMLIEALTQHQPVWEGLEPVEPVLPETVPAAVRDIVRHCLRRVPALRWTVADCRARLRETSAAPWVKATDIQRKALAKRHYIVLAVAVGLAVVAMLAVPKLLNRPPETPLPTPLQSELGAAPPSRGPVPGRVVKQVLPDVTAKAKNTIRGTVNVSVRLRVDPSGSVVGAEVDSPGSSRYFARQALRAARSWEFAAPKVDGQNVSSTWILRFGFTKTAINVVPVQEAP
jgi:TonB family protein